MTPPTPIASDLNQRTILANANVLIALKLSTQEGVQKLVDPVTVTVVWNGQDEAYHLKKSLEKNER